MIELLRRAAGERPAVISDVGTTTYGELLTAAEEVAAGLRSRGLTRIGLVEVDAPRVIAVLAGASLAGVEVCSLPPEDPEAVASLAARFGLAVLVSERTDLAGEVLALAALRSVGRLTAPVPAARPVLVLTTGTTGESRGVRHDWSRLVAAAQRVTPAPGQRWLLAYGLHQFAGLQVLVHVLSAGATLVAPTPRRPREGLAAMRAHGVTHASATPTFWRFLLAELRSDGGSVPALQQVTLGGEAVPGALLDELARVFPGVRLSQVYAASEFGATGSVRDGRPGLPASVLERPEDSDVCLRVVDGQLWVRSRIGMLGYVDEEPVSDQDWRPTGDLVEVVGDRLLFRGRTSDVINVGGVKVHPLPVEERVGAVPGVVAARVFGRPSAMTGAIVAVEVVLSDGADEDDVDDAIRSACADLPAAARPRSVRFVPALALAGDKTSRRVS